MSEGDRSVIEKEKMIDEEKEIEDRSELHKKITKTNLIIFFLIPCPVTAPKNRVSGK